MKLKSLKNSHKIIQFCTYTALVGLLVYGAMARAEKQPNLTGATTSTDWIQKGDLKARVLLSQTKILQGSDGLVHLQIDMESPQAAESLLKDRKPTDFVVVLDRSGSMSGEKKIDFALKAVEALLQQMNKKDRFALVTFDSLIEVPIPLVAVRSQNRPQLIQHLQAISPRGSTNLGGGLIEGMKILRSADKKQKRAQRLILISDGQANEGITDPTKLNQIAHRAVEGEFVVSTIGVGLDFNENLLASLADFGTGYYHFLEALAKLDKVLAQEFYGASQVYASGLDLRLDLAPDIKVVDASGYPLQRKGRTVHVQPGHLYSGQNKTFFVTLQLPTDRTYTKPLGRVALSYRVDDKTHTMKLIDSEFKVACLSPEKKEEAHASIRPETFKEVWTNNNYGRFLKESAAKVRSGDRDGALRSIQDYKAALGVAYATVPAPELKAQLDEMESLEADVNDSFSGPGQDVKQKRLSKQQQAKGIQSQRTKTQ